MLADTHVLIWALDGLQGRFGPKTWQLLNERYAECMVSAVSLLEIRMKQRRGGLAEYPTKAIKQLLDKRGTTVLPLDTDLICNFPYYDTSLPDPYDMLLVGQALQHAVPLITADTRILELKLPGLKLIDARQ